MFYNIHDYKITSQIHYYGKLYKLCPSDLEMLKNLKIEEKLYFSYFWCDLIYDLMDIEKFKLNVHKYIPNIKIKEKLYNVFYIYHYILNTILFVNKNIESDVKKFVDKYKHNPYVGVQIRVGNEDIGEQAFSDKNDIEVMTCLLNKTFKNKLWFVTGDSQKTKLKLCETYKNVFVYSKEKAKHYERSKRDLSIIIEHEILSKSSFMVISKSTFGLTALLKSGIFLNSHKNSSYEITRCKAYDVKNNFRNITSTWHYY